MNKQTVVVLGGTGRLGRVICHEFKTRSKLAVESVGRNLGDGYLDSSMVRCLIVVNRARPDHDCNQVTLINELDLLRKNIRIMEQFAGIQADEQIPCVVVSSACVGRDNKSASVGYHCHKAALEQAAISFASRGFNRFNVVRPGEFRKHDPGDEENWQGYPGVLAVNIAKVVFWLCSDESKAINGQIINVDGNGSRIIQ